MEKAHQTVNQVLVHLFNDILRIEEQALTGEKGAPDLSVKELHVIEAVCTAGEENTMASLAGRLHVTAGSLTVAVATLVRKGYLLRLRSQQDKRRVHILPTEKAMQVNALHAAFHQEMTQAVIDELPAEQLDVLVDALNRISDYFNSKENRKDENQ